ncbi:nucleoside recognition domain-containing protein [Nocardioides sp. Root151]|uniref:nucleoside recognition domain-containing protein n=1 Tax=Nocardioides sp. Root151 TaxID=1736475 RepID=UPI000702CE3A|nr:nucleoside recognition domain-containing protein [Nocardioides sp. Root151]KQZ75751.1 iron transporter FeoB [Nocardioides sp. Root151]
MSRDSVLDTAARLRRTLPEDFGDGVVTSIFDDAARIARASVTTPVADGAAHRPAFDQVLDRALTHRVWGFVVMGVLFFGVFWFTIAGAAVPSDLLYVLLVDHGHTWLRAGFEVVGSPWWVTGLLVDGVYLGTAWVVAVMLPPMAIFFPLFTLLEDFGYLPRVAFNLDRLFAGAGAHGKQSLTMMMGYGCNAAGVTATRIIDSPRERLIAIITNNFSVCNGRWPTLILMGTIFIGSLAPPALAGVLAAGSVVLVAVLGILTTLAVSWALSRTVLRGETSVYSLELPPYRPPQVWRTIYTSMVDRTYKVLRRALVMAAPAGAVIWLLGNLHLGGTTLAAHLVTGLEPAGWVLGLNGIILLAYLVAIPANEIVIPTILMLTLTLGHTTSAAADAAAGVMVNLSDAQAGTVLVDIGGWTLLTAVNLMLFCLLHNPCSTTMLTIWRETRSVKWTTLATVLPLGLAGLVCTLVALTWRTF